MTTRTIPERFPILSERDANNHRPVRARLLRNIAQAQNYLWAKSSRVYGGHAYEGWGNARIVGYTYPNEMNEPIPVSGVGHCVASFLVPPNWGAGQLLKVQGSSTCVLTTGDAKVAAQLCDLDGTPMGTVATETLANGVTDWSLELYTPSGSTCQVRVYVTIDSVTDDDSHSIEWISARYDVPSAAELGLDNLADTWAPLAYANATADEPLSTVVMKLLIRDTNHLHAYRNPEICHTYLGNTYANTTTWTEVGKYKVFIPSRVTSIAGRLYCYATDSGTSSKVRVKINGVVGFTSSALSADDTTDVDCGSLTVPDNAECTLTIEAQSDNVGASDWGTIVWGVWFWEDAVTLALPGGTSVPSDYQPLDEDLLVLDKAIAADSVGSDRAGIKKLLENNIWLARHRLRWLVGDWRHRVLKRISLVDPRVTPDPDPSQDFDWTPGPAESTYRLYAPKNITICAAFSDHHGSTSPVDRDSLGAFPHGYSFTEYRGSGSGHWPGRPASEPSMATNQSFERHGTRLGFYRTDDGTSTTPIKAETGAKIRWYARGRRLMPARPETSSQVEGNGLETPLKEGAAFKDLANLYVQTTGDHIIGPIRSSEVTEDTVPQWVGPFTGLTSTLPTDYFTINGTNQLIVVPADQVHIYEGTYHEVEMQSALAMDEPLSQADIDALS